MTAVKGFPDGWKYILFCSWPYSRLKKKNTFILGRDLFLCFAVAGTIHKLS